MRQHLMIIGGVLALGWCGAVTVAAAPTATNDPVLALITQAELLGTHNRDSEAIACLLAAVTNHPDAELAMRSVSGLYQSREDKVRMTNCFSAALHTVPQQRMLLCYYLARLLAELGDLDAARPYAFARAPLTNWLMVGGFENAERSGLRTVFGPEENLRWDAVYDGKQWPVRWRPAQPLHRTGGVSFSLAQPTAWLTVYLRTGVLAPCTTNVMLCVSCDGALRCWLNGRGVAETTKYPDWAPDMYFIPVTLQAGTNLLVFKVCMEDNAALFSCRIATRDNQPVFWPNIQPDDASVPLTCDTCYAWPTPRSSPGARRWRTQWRRNPDDAMAGLMLARYYKALERTDAAIKTYEHVREVAPLPGHDLLNLGHCYLRNDSDSHAIAMFRAALQRDPQANAARVAIGAHYLRRSMFELAMPFLQEALAVYTNDPGARTALVELYSAREWYEDAYRLARETCALHPTLQDAYLALAGVAEERNYDAEQTAALQNVLRSLATSFGARQDLVTLAYRHDDMAAVHACLDELARYYPHDPDVALMRLQALRRTRDVARGFAVTRAALAQFPDHGSFHKFLGDFHAIAGDVSNAIAAYQTCLVYQPDYLWLRRYVDFLQGKSHAFFAHHEYRDDAVAGMIARAMQRRVKDPAVLTEMVLRQSLIQLYADGSSRQQFHVVQRVLQPRGVQMASSVSLPQCEVQRAVTHKADGRVLESTHLTDTQIEFPDVQVGDAIEYKYVINRYGGSWLDEHFYTLYAFERSQVLMQCAEVILALASNRPLTFVTTSDTIRHRSAPGYGGVVHTWSCTNVPAYIAEPLSPPMLDCARVLALSTMTNWQMIAQWQQAMEADVMRGDQEVRRLAQRIAAGVTSPAARVAAVFRYITDNFRYTQMYENDIAGIKPHPVPDILANRCGDCKDLSLLMRELLRALDLQAYTALLRTANRSRIFLDVPAPDVFNHAIVYIPALNMFCDPTFRLGEYDLLPSTCQDVDALVLSNGMGQFVRTPLLPPEDSQSAVAFDGTLLADGRFTGTLVSSYGRLEAAGARQALERLDKHERIANYILSQIDPGARLLAFAVQNAKPTNLPLEVAVAFDAPRFAQRAGDLMTLTLPLPLKTEDLLGGLETRHYPLRLSSLQTDQRTYTLTFPAEMRATIPITNRVVQTRFGSFSLQTSVTNATVHAAWQLCLTQREIPPPQYRAFRRFLGQCAEAAGQTFSFAVPATANGATPR
jgi:tetratricopeptide (TPR) repeat protein